MTWTSNDAIIKFHRLRKSFAVDKKIKKLLTSEKKGDILYKLSLRTRKLSQQMDSIFD